MSDFGRFANRKQLKASDRASWLSVFLLFAVVMFFLWITFAPAFQGIRKSKRPPCINQQRQLGLAIQNHLSTNLVYPSAYTVDESGRPLHSWRTEILVELLQDDLYDSIDHLQPWHSKLNLRVGRKPAMAFKCPDSSRERLNDNKADFIGVVGEETIWKPNGMKLRPQDVKDGTSGTILFVESDIHRIAWMSTNDLAFSKWELNRRSSEYTLLSSNHVGGTVVTFADGSSRFLAVTTSNEVLRALLTAAGNDIIPDALD